MEKELKEIPKGSIIMEGGWWYVVVNVINDKDGLGFDCICDNANNIYHWKLKDITYIATPYEAMRARGWNQGEEKLRELASERNIPAEVIAEVLAGCHDNRFNHWHKK